jgi:hypothetical protein
MTAWNTVVSLTLAAVTTAVRAARRRRRPAAAWTQACHDRRDLRPRGPPAFGAHAGRIHARPLPIQLALPTKAVQDLKVQGVEHPGGGPLGQSPPAGRRGAAAQLAGGQPPRSRRAGHVDNRGETGPVRDRAVPATIGRPRRGREQGLNQRPELVRHEVVSKGRHGAGSCQTNPKGAKRRLSRVAAHTCFEDSNSSTNVDTISKAAGQRLSLNNMSKK